MAPALPVSRQWVIVLHNGAVVIDWGENCFQDINSGEFLTIIDQTGSRPIQDDECAWLERTGVIQGYDSLQVYVFGLPERSKKAMD